MKPTCPPNSEVLSSSEVPVTWSHVHTKGGLATPPRPNLLAEQHLGTEGRADSYLSSSAIRERVAIHARASRGDRLHAARPGSLTRGNSRAARCRWPPCFLNSKM